MPNRSIPDATIGRLPIYLRALLDLAETRPETKVSSDGLARLAGVNAAKVRKDLSYLGSYGTRGVGYDVEYLLYQITRELGLTKDWPAAVIGTEVGGLGVRHLDDLKEVATDEGIAIGIIATPPAAAQEVAERLVDAGVKSILNFAPAVVNVAPDVNVRKVDLSIELQILSFHMQRTQAIATAREANRRLSDQAVE